MHELISTDTDMAVRCLDVLIPTTKKVRFQNRLFVYLRVADATTLRQALIKRGFISELVEVDWMRVAMTNVAHYPPAKHAFDLSQAENHSVEQFLSHQASVFAKEWCAAQMRIAGLMRIDTPAVTVSMRTEHPKTRKWPY